MNSFICLVLLSLLAIGWGSWPEKKVTTNDIKALRKDLFETRGYDKYARPIPALDRLRVNVVYSLINIRELDVKTQTLTTDGWLWFQWHDESLQWESTEWRHINVLHVPPQEIYKPDIMFYNDVDHTSKKLVETKALVYKNGMVMWVPPYTSKALCQLNLKKWPHDEHICYFKLGSWTHDGLIMDVKSTNDSTKSFMSDYIKSPLFDIEFLNVTNEDKYYPCCKEPYPSVTFYFKLIRKPTLYAYIISMPALVAIISSLVTFWLPVRSNTRFLLNGISLLTLTLILLHLGGELGFSSLHVPIAVRFLSLTTLFIGITQIWFIIGYNISLINRKIPLWTARVAKPLIQIYKHSEKESNHLPQTESPDVSKNPSPATLEDLTFVLDKVVFVVFALGLAIICCV